MLIKFIKNYKNKSNHINKFISNVNTQTQRREILLLKKFSNERGRKASFLINNLESLTIQTLWSNDVHLCLYRNLNDNNSKDLNGDQGNDLYSLTDTLNLDNLIFQEEELFNTQKGNLSEYFNYEISSNSKGDSKGDNDYDYKLSSLFKSSPSSLTDHLVIRTPEEFSFNLSSNIDNIIIDNPEYTKLSSISSMLLTFKSNKSSNILTFKCKKLQSSLLKMNIHRKGVFTYGTIETKVIDFFSNDDLIMRIKKMMVVDGGKFNFQSDLSSFDVYISSIYAKSLEITHSYKENEENKDKTKSNLMFQNGNMQIEDKLTINSGNGMIIIDSLETKSFEIQTKSEKIRIFIKKLEERSVNKLILLNNSSKVELFFEENSEIDVVLKEISSINEEVLSKNKVCVYVYGHISSEKFEFSSMKISSWEYLKKRILSKDISKSSR